MADHDKREKIEPPDLSEKGGARNGEPQHSDTRLFMQLLAFTGCDDPRAAAEHLSSVSLQPVVYEDLNDPSGIAILALGTDPNAFIDLLRPALTRGPFAKL